MEETKEKKVEVPEEFKKLMKDFIIDLKKTFPEYKSIMDRWDIKYPDEENKYQYLFRHCANIFPERFFDILYKNADLFSEDSTINTEFLPGIVFKQLWEFDISDKTKDTIWNYLQLVIFSIMGSVKSMKDFGETAKLFETMGEDELKNKLQETLDGLKNVFENKEHVNMEDMPNPEDIHEHLQGMMGGKLGKLAMELAEETAQELNMDMENVNSSQEVFQKLMSNPGKLMNMVKSVGGKIDDKLKSGELNESELMSEGMDILNKMKNMPGMENMEEIFKKMGLGKGAKLNTGAMEARMAQHTKMEQMKQRMKKNLEKKQMEKQQASLQSATSQPPAYTEEELLEIFKTDTPDKKDSKESKESKAGKNKKNKKGK